MSSDDLFVPHAEVARYDQQTNRHTILGIKLPTHKMLLQRLKSFEEQNLELPRDGEIREGNCVLCKKNSVTKLWISHTLCNPCIATMNVLNRIPGDMKGLPFLDDEEVVKRYEMVSPRGHWVTLKFLPPDRFPRPSEALMSNRTDRSVKNLRKLKFSLLYGGATLIYKDGKKVSLDPKRVTWLFKKTPEFSMITIIIQQSLIYNGVELCGDFKAQLSGSPICKNVLHRRECLSMELSKTTPPMYPRPGKIHEQILPPGVAGSDESIRYMSNPPHRQFISGEYCSPCSRPDEIKERLRTMIKYPGRVPTPSPKTPKSSKAGDKKITARIEELESENQYLREMLKVKSRELELQTRRADRAESLLADYRKTHKH